jgi:hypothetical protein
MYKRCLSYALAAASRVHYFCNLQSRARTHAVLVIGLYELLDPTTELIEPPEPLYIGKGWVSRVNDFDCD